MKPDQVARFRHLAALWLSGGIGLSLVTWACFGLGLNFATTASAYLIVVVLLSLLDSFVSSAIFSVIAIVCLNYFFVEPRFTFQVNYTEDLAALAAFLIASLIITGLVRRLRDLGDAHSEQARLLDLTTDAVFVRNRDDAITYWNRGAQELYGWKPDEAIGRLSHQLLQTAFPATLFDIHATLARTGRWEGEVVHTARDGRRVTVASRWSRQQDTRGDWVGTLESNTDITARKRAEDALHRSQAAYLAEAQKLSLTGSFGWNVATGELSWSEESFRIFGYDPATKATVDTVLARVHPGDAPRVREVIGRAARDRQDFDFEHRLLLPDGSIKHLHVVAHAVTDEPGKPHFVGAVMDVTARKGTEEALRYSEHRYTNLFQAMAASFWELDFSGVDDMLRSLLKSGVTDFRAYFKEHPEFVREMMRRTRVVDVNDQTIAMFGRGDKAELLASVEPFWPEESTQVYADGVLAGAARKHSYVVECKLRRINGTLFDGLFTAAYPPDTMGKGSLIVGVIDITERKRAYAELERSEQRYRTLFHHMPIPLWRMNSTKLLALLKEARAQGVTDLGRHMDENPEFLERAMEAITIEEVNRSAVDLFGAKEASELTGTVAPYWRMGNQAFRRIMEARFRGEQAHQEETKLTTRDGRVLQGLFTSAFPPALSELGISINSFVDGTERIKAQARLEQVEADFAHAARVSMLGELTASIAHEVNQPLAAITTNGEAGLRWLAGPKPDLAEVSEIIGEVVADARRASQIIARVRTMARRQAPETTLLSLDEVIREAMLFLRHEVQARGVTISHHPCSAAPDIRGDRTQLQQVIVNLAVNAMQAMATAGGSDHRIVIRSTAPEQGGLCCTIEDSGPGLSPDQAGRLFESFFTTRDDGMGMGLPICRSIIEAHGGHIAGDNESHLGGARFSFTLPLASSSAR